MVGRAASGDEGEARSSPAAEAPLRTRFMTAPAVHPGRTAEQTDAHLDELGMKGRIDRSHAAFDSNSVRAKKGGRNGQEPQGQREEGQPAGSVALCGQRARQEARVAA